MDTKIYEVIIYEIRQNRAEINKLKESSIVMSTKFKTVVFIVSLLSGSIGGTIITKLYGGEGKSSPTVKIK